MQAEPGAKRITDWESIERHFRAGVLSIREIARLHDITDAAIRKKAKASDWQRDLTAKVAEKVRTELVRSEVRTTGASEQVRTEREIVDSAAATVVQVVREHRKDIAGSRNIVALLAAQLLDVAGTRDEFEATIEVECADDKTQDRRNKLMRAVSLPQHAVTVRDLSNAMKSLIGLERQAFSIGDAPAETPDPASAHQATGGFDALHAAFDKKLGKADAGPA